MATPYENLISFFSTETQFCFIPPPSSNIKGKIFRNAKRLSHQITCSNNDFRLSKNMPLEPVTSRLKNKNCNTIFLCYNVDTFLKIVLTYNRL